MRNNLLSPRYDSASGTHAAFSMLEICIVLIIVGLIAAGIVGGQSLMNASEIRNIPVRAEQYITAIDGFRQKYNALPGDMAGATPIWGRADGGTPLASNCAAPDTDASATSPTATCNGDGDQTIGRVAAQNYEVFRVWQHLKNAEFITGNYTGVAGAAGTAQELPGVNIPKGEIAQNSYDIAYLEDATLPAAYFTGPTYRHVLHYGSAVAGNNAATAAAISAADAYSVDLKVDDAKPGTGKVVTLNNTTQSTCASSNVAASATYQLTNNTASDCTLVFITGF